MLDKKDLQAIELIVDKTVNRRIKAAFDDFYENFLLPHVERSENHMERTEKQFAEIKEDLEDIKEHVSDHDKRIRKLEAATSN